MPNGLAATMADMPKGMYPRPVVTDEMYREAFDSNYVRGADDECWIWMGRVAGPYGRFCVRGRDMGAHVAALTLHGVTVPKGAVVRHVCDVEMCVNWMRHLLVGTQADNRRDAVRRGRTARGASNGVVRRFTEEDVRRIRAEVAIGQRGTQNRLAREYGCSHADISNIVHGRNYSWVPNTGSAP